MATFNLSNEIQIVNPSANVDSHYGTYASLSDAYIGVPEILREKGKTVGVLESGDVVEYWWKSGITDIDLVKKETSIPISGTTNTIPKFDTLGLVDSQIVDDGTNVTIGGGSNFYKFNVNGEILCKTNLYLIGDSGDIQGYSDSVAIGSIGFNKYSGANFGTRSELPLYFFTNYVEAMRVTTSQNVLIGTTVDTGQKLQVEGDALINGLTVGRGGGNIPVNVVLGNSALALNTIGLYNVAIGTTAIYSNTTGDNNIGIGANSLYLNTTGSGNLGIGPSTRCLNSNDNNSIMIGFDTEGVGSNSVVLGNSSITKTILRGNVLIGTTVDNGFLLNINGDSSINGHTIGRGGGNVASNLVIGVNSFINNVNGDYNTAIGVESLMSNQSGGSNVAIGPNSLRENTTGSSNTSIGGGSLYSNQTGIDNTAIGEGSLYGTTGGQNVAIGKASLRTTELGHGNIGIGYMAGTLNASDSNSIVIGSDALGAGSNTVVLGNNSITRTNLKGDVHFPMAILDALESTGDAGQILSSTVTGTEWITPQQNGLYAQTSLSTPIVYASGEASLIGAGVGTLSVPENAFKVGDSFVAKMCGILTCANNEILHIRVRSNGVLIIDALQYTLATTTNKYYDLVLDFTVTKLGGAGVAELFANGMFTYNKNAAVAMEGVHFGQISNTVFDTTVNNSLTITAEWVTSSATNTIRSQNFTLTKVY